MNTYFGHRWPSGVCDEGTQVDTPVGEPCLLCSEPIEDGDRGVFGWVLKLKEQPQLRPQHRECALRSVAGGIGHLTDCAFWCKNMKDPDAGLGYRRSSLRVWDHIMERPQRVSRP